jgi:predicted DNA-binding protein
MPELESDKDRTVSFRISGEAASILELHAQKRNTTMSFLLRELIENYDDMPQLSDSAWKKLKHISKGGYPRKLSLRELIEVAVVEKYRLS